MQPHQRVEDHQARRDLFAGRRQAFAVARIVKADRGLLDAVNVEILDARSGGPRDVAKPLADDL